jgi:hypothetical protein
VTAAPSTGKSSSATGTDQTLSAKTSETTSAGSKSSTKSSSEVRATGVPLAAAAMLVGGLVALL